MPASRPRGQSGSRLSAREGALPQGRFRSIILDEMDVEITWFGQTCFRIAGGESITIITDPYASEQDPLPPAVCADVVTVSHHEASCHHLEGVKGAFKLLDGPGEFEIGGTFITGVSTFADAQGGRERGLNTVFAFDFEGTSVCHLGQLGHVPTQSQVRNIGSVNVLLVPVGRGGNLTSTQASEVIGLFEPDIVIPMRYRVSSLQEELDSIDSFLKEMGVEEIDVQESLRVSESSVSEETDIVVLKSRLG